MVPLTCYADPWVILPPKSTPNDPKDFAIKLATSNAEDLLKRLRESSNKVDNLVATAESVKVSDTIEYDALKASINVDMARVKAEVNVKYKSLLWTSKALIGEYSSIVKYGSTYAGVASGQSLIGYKKEW